MTDNVLAAKAEWLAWAWNSVVLVHHEAATELDEARAAASGETDDEASEQLAATTARHAELTRLLWLFGKIADKPLSSIAWTPALDSALMDYADALRQQRTALVGLQYAVRNRPVQLRNAMMADDLAAVEQLAAATVDADEDAWTLHTTHVDQRLSPAVAAYRDAAAVERRLAQAVTAHVATDLRHEPLADLDALMRQARHGDGGLRLGIGVGHEIRAGAPDEILLDSDTSTRPDVVAATSAMTMFLDATFGDVVCESALSGRPPVSAAGIREIHRILHTGGGLTVYADIDSGPDHDPGHIAVLLRENGFDNVITHRNNHLIGHPAHYRMQRVTATKPPTGRSAAVPTPLTNRPPAHPGADQNEPDRTPPHRPPVVVRLADLIADKDPGHTSGFAERACRQIVRDPSQTVDIMTELRTTLTSHLGERLARNSAGTADYEVERWLRHTAGGALHGAAMGRLARVIIDHLHHHATLVPQDASAGTIAGQSAADSPGTLLWRAGRFWVQHVLSDFWDEVANDPAHRLHPLMRQTAEAMLNTCTAKVVAFSRRQRALATGELSHTSHMIVPPASGSASAKAWWLASLLANCDVTVSYLIAHGIAVQHHHQRRPTPAEFAAASGDLLRRIMNTSTRVSAAAVPFHADPIALSLEKWENTPGNTDPYAIHRQSPMFQAVTDNTAKAGVGEPVRRTGHCGGAIALHLPAGPENAALRELFRTAGIEPSDDTEFTAAAVLVAFEHCLAMDTLYPNMPSVTVLDDDVVEGYRRLDIQGFERQQLPGTPTPGGAAQEPFLFSRNPPLLTKAAQNVACRWAQTG